ncbi:hypothetical protein LAZ40_09390 [Cereibacter sphaeroides]|uniref:hypothetical protein n=1 Tax=Cereibacter sphaeroides TaxID=1063 RepID=UPI001F1D6909|nr:hypothetical protein [Cereibacter sphaeroides]MCE6959265.1 hypothetical protein [Cereibacter sphaeroides]MCE6972857.1 hypothetical protein [Cereibacter sphaeroides]
MSDESDKPQALDSAGQLARKGLAAAVEAGKGVRGWLADASEKRKLRAAAAEEVRQNEVVQNRYQILLQNQDWLDADFFESARVLYTSDKPLREKFEFFDRMPEKELREKLQECADVYRQDRQYRENGLAVYSCTSGDFLACFDENQVRAILDAAKRECRVSTVGHNLTMAFMPKTAFNVTQGLAVSAQAGVHNGKVNALFDYGIPAITFSRKIVDMNEAERRYAHFAWRLIAFRNGHGELRTIRWQALFTFIYSNCTVVPPGHDEYMASAPGEFRKRFAQAFWSPREAAAQLDRARQGNRGAEMLWTLPAPRLRILNEKLDYTLTES